MASNRSEFSASESLCLKAVFALLILISTGPFVVGQEAAGDASGELQIIQSQIQQGHLDEAKSALQAELQKHPSRVELLNLLGIVETRQHDYADALQAFNSALKIAPTSTKIHNNLGNLYVDQRQTELAEKEFRTTLRTSPSDPDGNYNLGVLLLARGSAAEAITHLERVKPTNTATRFNLVDAYFQCKRTAEALRTASELSAQNQNNVQVHFSLGVLLASKRQFKQAALELERAQVLEPETFEILYNLGLAYLRDGDFTKAELAAGRALKVRPESPDALLLLAEINSKQSRPLDALDLLVRARRLAPENVDVIYLMAQISISQDYFEDAIPLLETGLKLAPQRNDLRAALGESLFMAGKVDQAITEFKKLIEAEPSARTYAFLGLSYRHLGRFDEAKQYFQQGLKFDPLNGACLFNIGYIAERQGDSAGAELLFQKLLHSNPDYPDALLELANLRMAEKKLTEAEVLLRRFVKVSHDPSTGYYKLAMVERSLHETAAADRDLHVFQTLSKDAPAGPYPYEHLFDYLENRSKLDSSARSQLDITELNDQIKKHPDQPEDLYLLAEAYLKSGNIDAARDSIVQLDKLATGDYRTLSGAGVLLARHHLYDDAIQQFQLALAANPGSDDVKFDLTDAYFRKGMYQQALDTAGQISTDGNKDESYLALLGDIYSHLGNPTRAIEIYRSAIERNPDNDQDYLALALIELRKNDVTEAKKTLLKGRARIPGSGKILWGLGIASVLEGNNNDAAQQFEQAVELLPEWPGSYSTLGVFYFETGQITKAREVLSRFKNSNAGGLDVNRIETALSQAQDVATTGNEPMSIADRKQLLQLALTLADRTL